MLPQQGLGLRLTVPHGSQRTDVLRHRVGALWGPVRPPQEEALPLQLRGLACGKGEPGEPRVQGDAHHPPGGGAVPPRVQLPQRRNELTGGTASHPHDVPEEHHWARP